MSDSESKSELEGLAKVLDSKTVRRVYAEGASPVVREVGTLAQQVAEGLGLLAAPFRVMAVYRAKIDRWAERVKREVPPERQTEAPANVAGPVLDALRFTEEGGIVQELLLNLLTAAVDKKRQSEAHPALPKIIAEMSTEEAWFFYDFAPLTMGQPINAMSILGNEESALWSAVSSLMQSPGPDGINTIRVGYLDHLVALGLLSKMITPAAATSWSWDNFSVSVRLTALGRAFLAFFPDPAKAEGMRPKMEQQST